MKARLMILSVCIVCILAAHSAIAATYEVGEGKTLASVSAVPWESLVAGDTVLIYWREVPYKEKFVICAQGTEDKPIIVRGVPGPDGQLPVIDGNGATTRQELSYWSDERGVIKIGGSTVPADTMPTWITVENLDIRSAQPAYKYTCDDGTEKVYLKNASAIYLEKGEHITIRNCAMHDCGNAFFIASPDETPSRDIMIEGNHLYDGGFEGSIYEHNSYCSALGITYQYNHYGPLRTGCPGNNLKDRSAGMVVRYNWIESGNRQLDLVESGKWSPEPSYRVSLVYGNVLVETEGAGNRQMIHYGGDNGKTPTYRKGVLYLYNNTIVSTRSDATTLIRLSSEEETCDCRNNIIYGIHPGDKFELTSDDSTGTLKMTHNWLKPGYTAGGAKVEDDGSSITAESPVFVDEAAHDYHLAAGSPCIDAGCPLSEAVAQTHPVTLQYVKHQKAEGRPADGKTDIGAFEYIKTAAK